MMKPKNVGRDVIAASKSTIQVKVQGMDVALYLFM
jgi:hypothetical protein